jgi:hypothetical protein
MKTRVASHETTNSPLPHIDVLALAAARKNPHIAPTATTNTAPETQLSIRNATQLKEPEPQQSQSGIEQLTAFRIEKAPGRAATTPTSPNSRSVIEVPEPVPQSTSHLPVIDLSQLRDKTPRKASPDAATRTFSRRKEKDITTRSSKNSHVRKTVGTIASAAALSLTGLVAGSIHLSDTAPKEERTVTSNDSTTPHVEEVVTTITSTSLAPETTTTTEAPPVTYEATIGQEIGLLVSPVECNNIIHVNQVTLDQEVQMGDGTRRSPVDQMELLPAELRRAQECAEQAIERANQFGYPTRPDRDRAARNKSLYPVVNGEQSTAGDYKALAGISRNIYPGQKANVVIFAHGSTESSAYNDLGAMKPGDKKYFIRSDKKIFEYTMLEQEIILADNNTVSRIYDYNNGMDPGTGEYNNAYLTEYACSDQFGKPGSASHRLVNRSVLTDTLTMAELEQAIGSDFSKVLKATLKST